MQKINRLKNYEMIRRELFFPVHEIKASANYSIAE
jgi:hypothetical protein